MSKLFLSLYIYTYIYIYIQKYMRVYIYICMSDALFALVAVIHAPVAGDTGRDDFHCLLRRVSSGAPIFLLGGWNIRFDTAKHSRFGEFVFPSKHPVSRHTWDILESSDLWLLSTFQGCHIGPHDTWFAPGSGSAARLDFVGLPASCQVELGHSFVMFDLDLGHASMLGVPLRLRAVPGVPRLCLTVLPWPRGQPSPFTRHLPEGSCHRLGH